MSKGRPSLGSLNCLPIEVLSDILIYAGPDALMTAEQLSSPIRKTMVWVWKEMYETVAGVKDWRIPKPRYFTPKCWKRYYWEYKKEIEGPIKILQRGTISAKIRWRVSNIDTISLRSSDSVTIHLNEDPSIPTLTKWTITLQTQIVKDAAMLGVFVHVDSKDLPDSLHKVKCCYSLSLLSDHHRQIAHGAADGVGFNELANPRGWIFPRSAMENNAMENEALIEFDVTILPTKSTSVGQYYELLSMNDVPEWLKIVSASAVGRLAQFATNPVAAKKSLQGAGPIPLIVLFESPDTSDKLKTALAGCLWNILDTSTILLPVEMLQRIVGAACQTLSTTLKKNSQYLETAGDVKIVEACDGASQITQCLVNTMCGLMWNIPTGKVNRQLLASHPLFFPSIYSVLCNDEYLRSHVCCLHLLSSLRCHGPLPDRYDNWYHVLLNRYLSKEVRNGVALSHRDIVEFFLPLLFSSDLSCIAFGHRCITVFYFDDIDIY
eukprot:TRINITY_DN9795_c0_g1_i1.p1 TRINITY_DN9795_c0_g1~~TRINITY_DN9795_c0_g1_i1.p1  ORF type:complete len:513 (+),score=50.59 TRINITY_DN9795_c0_g1_i1:65-1540(+)